MRSEEWEAYKNRIREEARDLIIRSDPEPILRAIGINIVSSKPGVRYGFSLRDERTPSAYIGVMRDGVWRYMDFGAAEKADTILGVVMKARNLSYNEALSVSLSSIPGGDALLAEMEEITRGRRGRNGASREERARKLREKIREATRLSEEKSKTSFSKGNPSKRVNQKEFHSLYFVDLRGNEVPPQLKDKIDISRARRFAKQLLLNRGFKQIPPGFHLIIGQGVHQNTGRAKEVRGVGLPIADRETGEFIAGDIHYIRPVGSMKGRVLQGPLFYEKEAWGITSMIKGGEKPFLVFESKMDYAAVWAQIPEKVEGANIIVTNSASNFAAAAEKIEETYKDTPPEKRQIVFFNQSDRPGYEIVERIVSELVEKGLVGKEEEFFVLKYNMPDEYKSDPNDLLKNRVNIVKRLEKVTLETIRKRINWLKKFAEEIEGGKLYAKIRGKNLPTYIFEDLEDYTETTQDPKVKAAVTSGNVIVAHSPSQDSAIAKEIKENELTGKLIFINKGDFAGTRVVTSVLNALYDPKQKKHPDFLLIDYSKFTTGNDDPTRQKIANLTPGSIAREGISPLRNMRSPGYYTLFSELQKMKTDYTMDPSVRKPDTSTKMRPREEKGKETRIKQPSPSPGPGNMG